MARLKLIWDPHVDVRQNPRHLQNYLWAMTVMCPPDAPPGVAIAEFRTAREALNAERHSCSFIFPKTYLCYCL